MHLPNSAGQQQLDWLWDASGTLASATAPQLVLPLARGRSFLLLQNNSAGPLWFDFGTARATCSLTSGGVSSVSVTNGGFGFTYPPKVKFLGGGQVGFDGRANTRFIGGNIPNYDGPTRAAKATAVLTAGVVTSVTINDPGAGYGIAPYVFLLNDVNDPYGAIDPTIGGTGTSGVMLGAFSSPLIFNGTLCPTDPVAVFGQTVGLAFTAKWMT